MFVWVCLSMNLCGCLRVGGWLAEGKCEPILLNELCDLAYEANYFTNMMCTHTSGCLCRSVCGECLKERKTSNCNTFCVLNILTTA